jgi:tRNA nucleotidyltransferase (CCA-adding enzyme)
MKNEFPDIVNGILEQLEDAGYEAWQVGGSVRDKLLGQAPKDWDIATSADISVIIKILKGSVRLAPVGAKFGTVSLVDPGLKVRSAVSGGQV